MDSLDSRQRYMINCQISLAIERKINQKVSVLKHKNYPKKEQEEGGALDLYL